MHIDNKLTGKHKGEQVSKDRVRLSEVGQTIGGKRQEVWIREKQDRHFKHETGNETRDSKPKPENGKITVTLLCILGSQR